MKLSMQLISGQNLLKHKGLSGFGVTLESDLVRKWTIGEQSQELYDCMKRQKDCGQSLYPIEAVPVYSYKYKHRPASFEFHMPYLDTESGVTTTEFKLLEDDIIESFRVRSLFVAHGLNSIVRYELQNLKNVPNEIVQRIISTLNKETDAYLCGYAHGDFGFANMLLSEGKIKMIDFCKPFIDSPLLDLATMSLSAVKPEHLRIVERASIMFKSWSSQSEIICKVHLLKILDKIKNEAARADILQCLK